MRMNQMQLNQGARTLLIEDSANQKQVKAFVAARFADQYAAQVRDFMPHLLALVETGLNISAVLGYRNAQQAGLFLEAYLDAPIEQVIERVAGTRAQRAQIVELGNLSAVSAGATRQLVLNLAPYFAEQGARWLVMTATAQVRNVFKRLGLAELLLPLATADQAALPDAGAQWGSYYAHEPQVCALNLPAALALFQRNPLLSKTMQHLLPPARDTHLLLACEVAA